MHSAFIGALGVVLLATWRASEAGRVAFQSLVETLEEGVLMVDRGGALVAVNPSAERILGMAAERILAPTGSDPAWSFVAATARRSPRMTARCG